MTSFFAATTLLIAVFYGSSIYQVRAECLGEFQETPSGECTMSPNDGNNKYCPAPAAGKYVCPISKQCIDSVADYPACPGLKGTYLDVSLMLDQRLDFLIANLTLQEKYTQLTNEAPEVLRLGIPAYNWLSDDVHSVRNNHATVFPNGCGLGASFSRQALYTTARTVAIEARGLHAGLVHYGDRGTFNGAGISAYGPSINVVRDPRWGRAQEVYGEDPRLTSLLSHAFVTGYQYGGEQDDKYILVAACCKHLGAYDLENIPEWRMTYNAHVDAVNWGETYSPMFRQCVILSKGQHVMCSYNAVNGVPTCGSKDMLTTVLRDKWGFEGFVVSDYDAMANILETFHYTDTMAEAVALSVTAGCDQEGGGTTAIDEIPQAIAQGLMTVEDVNLAFRRIFRTRIMLGMFDPPMDVAYNYINNKTVEGDANLELARTIAQETMTLLRNRGNTLPLNPDTLKGIAVIGPQAIDPSLLTGNYANYPDKGCRTILEGLRVGLGESVASNCTQYENVGYDIDKNVTSVMVGSVAECGFMCDLDDQCNFWTFLQPDYVSVWGYVCRLMQNVTSTTNADGMISGECIANKNKNSRVHNANGCESVACTDSSGFEDALNLVLDMYLRNELSAIVITLGLSQDQETEERDRTNIELPGYQNALVNAVYSLDRAREMGVPIICVLIHGGTVALGASATLCDAVLDAWYPGQMGGYAIADTLFGYYNPAGRAAATFYESTADLPVPGQMNEYAGQGVTYRYFKKKPLYPFGFGLSYTTFAYSNLRHNASDNALSGCDILAVTVTVKNTGERSGDEVVQLYVDHSMSATVPVPQIRLADFQRIQDLNPGQSQDVTLVLTPRYHSAVYNTSSPNWFEPDIRIEQGTFVISVGGGQPAFNNGTVSQSLMVIRPQPLSACSNQD
mmetsp:Transcript_31135/g.50518  ORF Transcript_31135/g.50518 Transcript_31135/m.50518 type:complete len:905 (-) Transcript_31135:13-2727(-)